MRKLITLIGLVFFTFYTLNAQLLLWEKSVDMGILSNTSNNFTDIPIKNLSKKDVFVFRLDVDKRYNVLFSNKKISPDSTIFIRLSFSPLKKGVFNEKIAVHFSCFQEPKFLEINGFANEVISSAISCPSFTAVNTSTSNNVSFSSSIINSQSNEKLNDYEITLLKDGIPICEKFKQKKGAFKKDIPIGLYYIIIEKEGFQDYEKLCYVNRKNSSFTFSMTSLLEHENTTIHSSLIDSSLKENNIKEENNSATTLSTNQSFNKIEFNSENYLPNNIVFLLDVSTSMKYNGKLELLKASMQELAKLIRPSDKVTIIGYSSTATVLLNTTYGNNKDTLKSTISGLTTKGLTAGGKGLKLACKQAMQQYINNGNNQVIIATDGDFNQGDENVNRIAKKYRKCGLKISVVGIKTKPEPEKNMLLLAKNGGGNYLPINGYKSATFSLVNEIKINSFKGLKK